MSVDMHEYKFIMQLERLPPFEPGGGIDRETREIDFPAWRAVFSSMILWGHSTGYRLLDFESFFVWCERTYLNSSHGSRFQRWFSPPYVERTKQRIKFWYESGMAETYLYACLVDVFEDILKEGVVIYDPRLDWKQKWDAAVVTRSHKFYINAMWGGEGDRKKIEERRDEVERQRKQFASGSAHWDNKERERWTALMIGRSDADCQTVNGVRLFSIASINALLKKIYDCGGYEKQFFFPESARKRQELYKRLIRP